MITWGIFSYEKSVKFYNFPVPKFSKVLENRRDLVSYSLPGASESKENGLPFIYRLHIKSGGWEEDFQEGSLTVYSKDGKKINVIAETDYVSISINKD